MKQCLLGVSRHFPGDPLTSKNICNEMEAPDGLHGILFEVTYVKAYRPATKFTINRGYGVADAALEICGWPPSEITKLTIFHLHLEWSVPLPIIGHSLRCIYIRGTLLCIESQCRSRETPPRFDSG